MSRTSFTWVVPPSTLTVAIEQYGQRAIVAVKALADYIAQRMQDDMRTNAPWTDRTGLARSGLFCVAEQASRDLVSIYISHGTAIDYGKWLEVRWGGRYAIIQPTVQKWLPEIQRMLKELLA